jgi:hypothetical protein
MVGIQQVEVVYLETQVRLLLEELKLLVEQVVVEMAQHCAAVMVVVAGVLKQEQVAGMAVEVAHVLDLEH